MMAKPKCEICNDKRAKRKCLVFNGQFTKGGSSLPLTLASNFGKH